MLWLIGLAAAEITLLSDEVGKTVGAALRSNIVQQVKAMVVRSQQGDAFGSRSCEAAHVCTVGLSDSAAARNLSIAKLFIDVIDAFASIVTALCLDLKNRHDTIVLLLSDCGFSIPEIAAILMTSSTPQN